MTYEKAYKIISEFCFTGYKDNKKPTGELFSAIHELVCKVEENTKLKAEIEQWQSTNLKLVCELTRLECENYQLKAQLERSVKLPCKVGDKLFSTENGYVEEFKVRSLNHIVNLTEFSRFDETVFFTREEAEQSLKGQV